MAGTVTFRRDRCKGCEPEDMEQCVGCASCAKICPDSIITVERT